jgi:hypothetical protein
MQTAKAIAIGFVAGLAVGGGAVLLLRDDTSRAQETARIARLGARIQRLDEAVARLSALAAATPHAVAPASEVGASPVTATPHEPIERDEDQTRAIAAADNLVDRGLQSGHWSREQANDLSAELADLDVKEQGRIQARISAAINAGQLQIELP